MPIDELSGAVQYVMDLLGIFTFALTGAFLAVRKDFDFFGTVILSEAAGLGGGLFRDLVLGVTPVAFTDLGYFFTPCVAAAGVYFGYRLRHDGKVHEGRWFDLSDAAALGLFSVTGTIKALSHGFNIPAAVTLGSASAVGGGVLAHLLALELPTLLRWNRDLYALPALVGASAAALLHYTGALNVATAVGASLFAFGLRLLALRYNWRTPRSGFWRNPFAGMRQVPPTANRAPDAARARAMEADTVMLPPAGADAVTPPPSSADTVTLRLVGSAFTDRKKTDRTKGVSLPAGTPVPGPETQLLLRGPGREAQQEWNPTSQERASHG